jgi:hypothetical protein
MLMKDKAESFYTESLKLLKQSKTPFMVGGTFAINAYIGLNRETKDLDIFCKAGDYPKILQTFADQGYKTQVTDERWLAKVSKGRSYIDIIFNSAVAVNPVTDQWFKESQRGRIFGIEVSLLPPTELIWAKAFVEHRGIYHGNDIAHMILIKNKNINWKRLFSYMDQYWEVLLVHILRFRFIYPSEREIVPRWLIDELLERFNNQLNLPTSKEKVCRGRILSPTDFEIDVREWGFTDLIGWKYDNGNKK